MCFSTASTKGHFCSLLISNIYWLTSLSTDSTITVSYLDPSANHFFTLHIPSAGCSFVWEFLLGKFFVFALAIKRFQISFASARKRPVYHLLLILLLALLTWYWLSVRTQSVRSTCFGSLAIASRIHVRFPFLLLCRPLFYQGFRFVCALLTRSLVSPLVSIQYHRKPNVSIWNII